MDTMEIFKAPVISNINNMERAIGVKETSFEYLNSLTYDQLHEKQNGLIKHYNEAVNNMRQDK